MLTTLALNNRALTLALLIACIVIGAVGITSHPSREDPSITIRNASVLARYPGMSAARIEQLITSKLEEKVREIPEVDTIETISSTGQSLVKLTLADKYTNVKPIWADLRNKMDDVKSSLPNGTEGPFISDDKGNVAMATVAITGDGFSIAEIYQVAKTYRRDVYAKVPGVRKVEFFGVEDQRIFVEFDNVRLARMGLDPRSILNSISERNIILPGGKVEADGKTFYVEPTGDFSAVEELRNIAVSLPDSAAPIYLSDIATVIPGYEDPPRKPVFWNGRPAIIVSISMVDQFDAFAFGEKLKATTELMERTLPVGYKLDLVTWQPKDIERAVFGVFNNLWQTVLVVLLVVIAFLGLRTGLIVGAMVPLVMIISIIVMRLTGIDLERMSLASLIIALGLLVDNGIVVAEDIKGRLERGEERVAAAIATGSNLSMPLFAASLTTILAFMPLMLAPGAAGEYTRSISLVIAIALIVSWVVALTALILLCIWFLRVGEPVDDETAYGSWYYDAYRALMRRCLAHRVLSVAIAFSTLGIGVFLFQFAAKTFFPQSERTQLQVIVELPQGSNSIATRKVTERIEGWLLDKSENPDVTNVVTYIADGGPRFYLALSPIDGTPNSAYMLVEVASSDNVIALSNAIRLFTANHLPEAEVYPKPMSMGPSESGLVEYRIVGPDEAILKRNSEQLQLAMRRIPGTVDVTDDWKNPTVTIQAVVDQEAARRAGISSEDIANALNSQLSGSAVTNFRVGDVSIPIVFRSVLDQRTNLDRLRSLNIAIAGASPVPLIQVARLQTDAGFSQVKRRDLERTITVSAKSLSLTASALDAKAALELEALRRTLPYGYRIEKGGELEGSSDAQEALFANVPLAFALMFLVLIWQFNSFLKPLMIFLTIPLVITGVGLSLVLMPGANFSFMGILGFLALSGIVINNAIVLIDRIEIERSAGRELSQAIVEAGVRRLQPIVMTTITTAMGLLPIILSKDVLFYDLAVVIAGGLLVGTVLTLVVVPSLYALFYGYARTSTDTAV